MAERMMEEELQSALLSCRCKGLTKHASLKEVDALEIEIRRGWAEIEKMREALEDMCGQFAYWSDAKGGYCTGGLSVLEEAFELLGWDDPQVHKAAQCDEPRCKKQATCGAPTKAGYRRTCSKHMPKPGPYSKEEEEDA